MESKTKKINEPTSDPTINIVLDTIKLKKQALVFVNTKRSAEKTAEETSKKIKETNKELTELSEKILAVLQRPTKQCERLAFCVKKGMAFHHSGLHSKQRDLIESAFKKNIIHAICATPTLCLSKDTNIWHNMSETKVSKFKKSHPIHVLSGNKIIKMKAQDINCIDNFSELIQISSVSGHSIKVTPNHKMLIKRNNTKQVIQAKNIRKGYKIATIGKLDISNQTNPRFKDFILDNKLPIDDRPLQLETYYFIGAMLGDGYSGAETVGNKIKYKGAPTIVGKDEEIFQKAKETCKMVGLNYQRSLMSSGTTQLVLGKNKWFREFLCRCGIEKREKKHISQKLMSTKLKNIASLLRGLFDTDGYVEKKGAVGFSNTSKQLVKQIQKCLLRFGIISRIRIRPASSMQIYGKSYQTLPFWELLVANKISIYQFYKNIGFGIKRKQDSLTKIVRDINSNIRYSYCETCNYKIYQDLFSGRTKEQKIWGKTKLDIISTLGEKGEMGSRELKDVLKTEPKKKETRLNHHYELISRKKVGHKSKTEWFWSLNKIGKYIFKNLISKEKDLEEFFKNNNCPICNHTLKTYIKKGWKDSDFDGDIYWDIVRETTPIKLEQKVYDVILPPKPKNSHLFVAEGFIVHNSAGVDLPAYRSILKDLKRFTHRGLAYIPVLEFEQMAGRAGRPKYDNVGEAILISKSESEKKELTERYIEGEVEDIYSKLAVEPVLRTYLLSLIATNFVNTKKEILDFFSETFWAFQFRDLRKLESIIDKMLLLLEDWEFIVSTGNEDFVSAGEINDSSYKATPIGKRVAEMYIDPLTASHLIECIKRGASKNIVPFSLLQAVSNTLEMRPLLKVRTKEWDFIQEVLIKFNSNLIDLEPSLYEPEYEDFTSSVKTAMFMQEWIDEKDEEYLLEKYNVRPGEIRVKLDTADWLLYASEEITRILQFQNVIKEIKKLRIRLKHGAKEELLPLIKFKDVGRVRARKMFNNEIKDVGDVKKADYMSLKQLLGEKIAQSIKKQVGEEITEVSKGKRKGQMSINKY